MAKSHPGPDCRRPGPIAAPWRTGRGIGGSARSTRGRSSRTEEYCGLVRSSGQPVFAARQKHIAPSQPDVGRITPLLDAGIRKRDRIVVVPQAPESDGLRGQQLRRLRNRSRALSAHNRASRNSPNSIKDLTCPAQAGTLVGLCSSTRAKSRSANSKSPRLNARAASDDQCVSPAAGRRDC